jgi:hypothetical protein
MAWGILQWLNAHKFHENLSTNNLTNFHDTWKDGIYRPTHKHTKHGDFSVYGRQVRKQYLWRIGEHGISWHIYHMEKACEDDS